MTRTKTRALANWPNNAVSVLDFGAVGDGVTDDTAAFQQALTSSDAVFIPSGHYIITDSLELKSNNKVWGLGASSYLDCTGFPDTQTSLFTFPGLTTLASTTLSQEIVTGTYEIPVASSSGFKVGAYIRIRNGVSFDFNDSNIEDDPGSQEECLNIVGITGNTIRVTNPVSFTYPNGAAVFCNTFVNSVSISSLRIETDSDDCPVLRGVGINNLKISDIDYNANHKSQFITLERCYDSIFEGCNIKDTGKSVAYAFNYHCSRLTITGNVMTTHDLNTAGDGYILLYYGINNCTIANNVINGYGRNGIYGICIHTKSWGNTVTGNTVSGVFFGIGGLFGAFNNTITGNSISTCPTGISITNCRQFAVSSNNISNSNPESTVEGAIAFSESYNCSVSGNTIGNVAGPGILFVRDNQYHTVIGNTITKCEKGIQTTQSFKNSVLAYNSIYDMETGIDLGIAGDITIKNNIINKASRFGIAIYIPAEYNITDNSIMNVSGVDPQNDGTGYAIKFGTGSNVGWGYIHRNIIRDCYAGLFTTPINITSFYDNTFQGYTGDTITNGNATLPTAGLTAPAGYVMPKIPSNASVADTVFGWRKISDSGTGPGNWVQINKTETTT